MTQRTAVSDASLLRHRDSCRLCEHRDLTRVLSLAPSPPANAFVPETALDREQAMLPLDLWLCDGCVHVQILDVVDPSSLFEDYVYASGTSPVFVRHFEDYARDIGERAGLIAGDLVVDIGSNDGTLLRFFRERGQRILGIDPAREIARAATETGVETIASFFTPTVAARVREEHGPAKVITANNVFAHVDDLSPVTDGVRMLLAPDGLFVFEVSYLVDVLEKTLFDTIYHEHLDYHTVEPLVGFLARHGLELIDAVRVHTHGGSLRAIVQHAGGPCTVSHRVADLVALERRLGVDRIETFEAFKARIDRLGWQLRGLLNQIRASGKRTAGFGAPAKATTLMHQFGVGPDMIEFIIDDSPLKQGLYTPGLHVPVLPSSAIAERRPDYMVILAWNFAESIMAKHQAFLERGGHFIVPVPDLRVV